MGYIAVLFINISVIASFTFLAWHFDKWWIVLFSILFMMNFKSNKGDDDDEEKSRQKRKTQADQERQQQTE